jgi:hypothetical protein
MNWKVSGVGLEPWKVGILAALLLVLVYFLWPSSHGDESSAPARPSSRAAASLPASDTGAPAVGPEMRPPTITRRAASSRTRDTVEEFRPSLRKIRLANTDPSRVDPTLRLDLLAKLQNVKLEGSMRSLFEAQAGPPQPINDVAPVKPKGPVKPMPTPAPAVASGPPPPPPPPPIPLKFYGFINPGKTGDRRAFFLDGDDIFVATEGETLQKRYKIVRIGVNSAVVEDTQFGNNQQTLPLVAEAQNAG